MHVLITGARHTGKSTLIRELAAATGRPLFGFITKKESDLPDPEKGIPVYIYPPEGPRTQNADNIVGYCKDRGFTPMTGAFDRFAPQLVGPPRSSLVVMDEIGFMETGSEAFRNAILALLSGDVPVLAAVKPDDHPFLNAMRAHPGCRVFELTADNRDRIRKEILSFIQEEWR